MTDCILPSPEQYRVALETLEKGGIVAYPTETFYGLAVDPRNDQAISALYALKKRERRKPLSLLVPNMTVLSSYIRFFHPIYYTLTESFWPGPLTLVFPAQADTSILLRGGGDTLAIRISSHPVAQKLCSLWGGALTATSANESGKSPLLNAVQLRQFWGDQINYVLDGGTVPGGKGSTMVEVIGDELHILRNGVIDTGHIFQVLEKMKKNS
ncbi:MAG: threonylcarbamoyl-AMP synthase [Proteobacteria bacterium]|nr:threonylcarbamoyl-AMP synthase [Pseudomonadota bacterium]MBU1231476.1 threonylcarbamoyl-AMP synthase [Pseudomonadota bacterium]MBU1417016.1 threonylcarbamoyl-AMP synthase [Pseudomonadota bacterium]MBU1453712.1 threonylcarbamoyl-AMP synthase [Pseudomonadota bacterium]